MVQAPAASWGIPWWGSKDRGHRPVSSTWSTFQAHPALPSLENSAANIQALVLFF